MELFPPFFFYELGKYLSVNDFIRLISVSHMLRRKVLESPIIVSGKVDFSNGTFLCKYKDHLDDLDLDDKWILNETYNTYRDIILSNKVRSFTTTKFNYWTPVFSKLLGSGVKTIKLRRLNVSLYKEELEGLEKLVFLESLKINRVSTNIIEKISALKKLSSLHLCLDSHSLANESVSAIAAMNLEELTVEDCDNFFLGSLKKTTLKCLTFINVTITGGIYHLSSNKTLKALSFSDTNITDAFLYCLANLENLERLTLFGCERITDISPLRRSKSLKFLSVEYCSRINDRSFKKLHKMTSLHSLCIRGCDIGNSVVYKLCKLVSLHTLDISENERISDKSIIRLVNTGLALSSLSLPASFIKGKGIIALSRIPSLRSLELWSTSFNTENSIIELATKSHLTMLTIHVHGRFPKPWVNILSKKFKVVVKKYK